MKFNCTLVCYLKRAARRYHIAKLPELLKR
jgi:hypothetical protein